MAIRTTLNLDVKTSELLDHCAHKLGISRSNLVIILSRRLMAQSNKRSISAHATRYQRRNPKEQWKTVHIRLMDTEYSFLVEMRCFYRFSVSFLICKELWDFVNIQNNIDNKKFIRHFVDKKIQYGHKIVVTNNISSIIWHLHWTNTPTKK